MFFQLCSQVLLKIILIQTLPFKGSSLMPAFTKGEEAVEAAAAAAKAAAGGNPLGIPGNTVG